MQSSFQRKFKYQVQKIEDISKYLTTDEVEQYTTLINKIAKGRENAGKRLNTYVVVNEDEPYAEVVWKLVELGENVKKGFWRKPE